MAVYRVQSALVNLPGDVHSYIFRNLSLGEIGRIRQTCSRLNTSISDDKQLWLYILERDIRSKAMPLPTLYLNIEKATAGDVMQWINSSIVINKNYLSGTNFTVARKKLATGATWTKLVRGRWCLIACSDLDASQLLVWDLQSPPEHFHKATFHLGGPVVDGIVKDTRSEILIALTVGKRLPSILVLQLFTDGKEIRIRQVSEIPRASHVRLLQRPYVGFSVINGDDTYPSIFNWETGLSRRLVHPESVHDYPISREWGYYTKNEPCTGMILWGSIILVIFPHKIVIFGQDRKLDYFDDTILMSAAYLQVHHMLDPCAELCIIEDDSYHGVVRHPSVLHLLIKIGRGWSLELLTVRYDEAIEAPQKLVFDPDNRPSEYLNLPFVEDIESSARLFCLGPSSQRAIVLAINHHRNWPRPCLYTAQVKRADNSVRFSPTVQLSSSGMPLFYEASSMDFDDSFGMLVIATINGELCVSSFGAAFPPANLDNDLPVSQSPSDLRDALLVDLPYIYQLHGTTTPDVREKIPIEAAHAWKSDHPIPQVPGWSSDWSLFRNTAEWIAAFPRWGSLDRIAMHGDTISLRIRIRLATLGEIIPVLFDEADHFRILFRIGDQMYYCKSKNGGVENADDDEELSYVDYADVLGVLPITYPRFLGMDTASIQDVIAVRRMHFNLECNDNSFLDDRTYCHSGILSVVRDLVTLQYGDYPGDKLLEEWTDADWDAIRDVAWRHYKH